jgi:AraC-like DNA-binding protein
MSRNGQTAPRRTAPPLPTRSIDPDDYQDVPRPVAAMPKDFPAGHVIAPHRHKRAQLVFAASGVMTVSTASGQWAVPPNRALWLPAGVEHSVRMSGRVEMRTLYIRPDVAEAAALPREPRAIAVTPLLRELILAAVDLPVLYAETGREARIMALILDEIAALPRLPLHLPMPEEPRLRRLCERIAAAPGKTVPVAEAASATATSARNFARLFRGATGMSFGAWCRQARLLDALTRLAAGQPVTRIAYELGYDSPSAFTSMFRRHFGAPPSRAGFSSPRRAGRVNSLPER